MPEKVLQVDFLIVGAGIAGCSLALELHAAGKRVLLLDPRDESGGSRVAAGIVNPIVPKGVKMTWGIAHMFPGLEGVYRRWEGMLGAQFFQAMSLVQVFANEGMALEWEKRMADPETAHWIGPELLDLEDMVEDPAGHCLIKHCGRLDVNGFCDAVAAFFEKRGEFRRGTFAHAQLKEAADALLYEDIRAGGIIFCEGMGVKQNPWFGHLPFIPVAGDILELSIPGLPRQRILKNGFWLVPVEDGSHERFLAGSNYHAGSESREPVQADAEAILAHLHTWIRADIRLIAHKRGVRPTVQRRRPYIGRHPEHDRLYIFNGFGSKGVSLCPWLAGEMRDFLISGKALPEEVGF